MKFTALIIFFTLSLIAENMSLGPYNDADFKTREEKTLQELKEKEAKAREQEAALQRFYKRQAELKAQEEAEYKARLKKAEEQRLAREALKREEEARLQAQVEAEREEKVRFQEQDRQALEEKRLAALTDAEGDYNITLTPEQADLSINNPDDLSSEIVNVNRLRDILLYSDDTPESVKEYIRFLDKLKQEYNLDFAFIYRGIVQAELDSSEHSSGGKFDIIMYYTPLEQTQIALNIEGRHQVGQYSSAEFRDEIGTLSTTSAAYGKEDLFVSELWVQQSFAHLKLRAGKIDPSSFIDSHHYKSSSRFFFNSTFSSSPYNAYPALGLGVAGTYAKEDFYITAEITDANAIRDEINKDFFTENDYYTAIEAGLTPKDGSKYHLTAWHVDANRHGKEEAKGAIASFVQVLDESTHLIIRGALSDHASAKRYASLGIGKTSLIKENDITGLAVGTLVPSDSDHRTQTSIEAFYRADPLPGIQLSADLQFIHHPSKGDQTWAVLPGLRLRVLF